MLSIKKIAIGLALAACATAADAATFLFTVEGAGSSFKPSTGLVNVGYTKLTFAIDDTGATVTRSLTPGLSGRPEAFLASESITNAAGVLTLQSNLGTFTFSGGASAALYNEHQQLDGDHLDIDISFLMGSRGTGFRANYLAGDTASIVSFDTPFSLVLGFGPRSLDLLGLAADGSVGYITIDAPRFANTPVPEPSSWALMMIGFGLIGGSIRSARDRCSLLHS